jgi:hypothetical protein
MGKCFVSRCRINYETSKWRQNLSPHAGTRRGQSEAGYCLQQNYPSTTLIHQFTAITGKYIVGSNRLWLRKIVRYFEKLVKGKDEISAEKGRKPVTDTG